MFTETVEKLVENFGVIEVPTHQIGGFERFAPRWCVLVPDRDR
jgi:hypothetical protein